MPVTPQALCPLTSSRFTLSYNYKHELQYIATRYTAAPLVGESKAIPVCLMITTGVGCTSDLWIPAIKHLFNLQAQFHASLRIISIWVVDRPNHDDAAVLNEKVLNEFYAESFDNVEYGMAVRSFIEGGCLSDDEKENLVAIAHSGSGASVIKSLRDDSSIPYRAIVMVEPLYLLRSKETVALFGKIFARARKANAAMPMSFRSKKEAMKFLTSFPPWSFFDDDNLRVLSDTYFIEQNDGSVKLKTPNVQRTASFTDLESGFWGTERVQELVHHIPLHAMMGAIHDQWPEPFYAKIWEVLNILKPNLASLTVIEGAGHHIPHQKPEEMAVALFDILAKGGQKSKL
ncbi:uncharacterized protein STEHIDRAFT_114446 [Stereum hirsutum FP-91666 SS1]|uniref:uncharacterized protein n=1 Tax=Stereum hirsutum (strain FP-91666) TaxID=721885 RepID=UPI0004449E2A|nr:uncharacterized protein STEHIDRAFT_114446 [Stereum hirsutum FP-91666 SS1]EIM82553.1 hypothetical protein STEHIDRAFT_114446 [Stereum hirsutum FP-91666 SS1]